MSAHSTATNATAMPMPAASSAKGSTNSATELPEGKAENIQHLCKRAYRALELSGYARIDLRLDEAGNPWVIEANPNPQIAKGEDFAASAQKIGLGYEAVLQKILNLGLRWQPESVA